MYVFSVFYVYIDVIDERNGGGCVVEEHIT